MILSCLLATVIELTGVTGGHLSARAYFDANNVRVGDPMILTIDFVGEADFSALHPPELSRHVDKLDWRVDDQSAKTDTFNAARRIIYRVRPLRQGVLWFPAMEYAYRGIEGEERVFKANAIPVHVKTGRAVDVEGLGEDAVTLPDPDDYLVEPPEGLGEDERFAWRKALAHPTADAFAEFDFPAAKLNEARAATMAGDWRRALRVYSRLEWTTGQTPQIERGIVAARARQFDNAAAELPVWRVIGRPILKYPLWGRVAVGLGAMAAAALVFILLGRGIRRLAVIAIVAAGGAMMPAEGAPRGLSSLFNLSMPGFGMPQVEMPKLAASFELDRDSITVGEDFNFIIKIEAPPSVTVDQIKLQPVNNVGMEFTGRSSQLTSERAGNRTNVVHRISVSARYMMPFQGDFGFVISGMATMAMRDEESSMTFQQNFAEPTPLKRLMVKPLPSDNQPADFSGIIAESLDFQEHFEAVSVETNDVISVVYTLRHRRGYLPQGFLPEGVAFEASRTKSGADYVRYVVADGMKQTPISKMSYYDPVERVYKRVQTGGRRIRYRPTTE